MSKGDISLHLGLSKTSVLVVYFHFISFQNVRHGPEDDLGEVQYMDATWTSRRLF